MIATRPIVLMTRPRGYAEPFVAGLRDLGAPDFDVIYAPLFDIRFSGSLPDIHEFGGLIFTSANGVAAYINAGGPAGLTAWCVGAATAKAATKAGLRAQSADGDADALVAWLQVQKPTGPLLHVRGRHARGAVSERLSAAGITTRDVVLYDQSAKPLSKQAIGALNGSRSVVLPIFSPRSARMLADHSASAPLWLAVMSKAVAKAAGPLHWKSLVVAARPDAKALSAETVQLLQKATALEGQRPEV